MKQFILTIMLLAAVMQNIMADELQAIVVTRGSDKVTIALADQPKVTFADSQVILSTGKQTLYYSLSDNVSISIATISDNIASTHSQHMLVVCNQNAVVVSNAKPGTPVALYTADGKQIQATRANAHGCAKLPVSANGVFVLKAGETTVKIQN